MKTKRWSMSKQKIKRKKRLLSNIAYDIIDVVAIFELNPSDRAIKNLWYSKKYYYVNLQYLDIEAFQ